MLELSAAVGCALYPLAAVLLWAVVPGDPGARPDTVLFFGQTRCPQRSECAFLSSPRREGRLMADEYKSPDEAFQNFREELYRSLLEAYPDAVVMLDLRGQILFASSQTRQLIGLSASDDLKGRSVFDYVIEDDRQRFVSNLVHLAAAGVRRDTQYTVLRPDGATISVEVSSAVVREGTDHPQAIMAVIRDITQRKRAQETLQQSVDQLQTIYNGMIEGLVITDLETKRFVRVNSSLCQMLGYSVEEFLTLSLKDIHPPEVVPDDMRRFQAAAEGRVSINEDRPVLRKDGSILYADITGHRIVYDGRPCLLALFRDVTERRQIQESLKEERKKLLHMLRASDCERQWIAYEIHDGLAQDLAAAIMQFQAHEHMKKQKRATAETAYDAGRELLQQAYFEARRLISGVRPPILDESGLIAALEHLIHDQQASKGPVIEFQSDVKFDRLPLVLENSIYRMAQEALANACRHSGSHKVRVSLVQDHDQVRLEVEDWGVGFHPEAVTGDRFGLEGIRERVRLLGGQVTIESHPGRGSTIRVILPLLEAEQAQPNVSRAIVRKSVNGYVSRSRRSSRHCASFVRKCPCPSSGERGLCRPSDFASPRTVLLVICFQQANACAMLARMLLAEDPENVRTGCHNRYQDSFR